MLSARQWLQYVLFPFLATLLVDQGAKRAAAQWLFAPRRYGPVGLAFDRNTGFFLGSLQHLTAFETIVLPTALGGVLLFAFVAVQYFLPLKSVAMRAGLSVFVGAVASNLGERLVTGAVADFVQLSAGGYATGLFNIADALQWGGVAVCLASYLANGALLYPVEQRRGRKWIDAGFQGRFCAVLVGSAALAMAAVAALAAAFLRYLASDPRLEGVFLVVFAATASGMLLAIGLAGIAYSHRIVGPLKAFENFLDAVASGDAARLALRQGDELRQLEALSDRFLETVGERLGLAVAPLAPGRQLTGVRARTWRDEPIELDLLRGRRVWLMFLRYASCPLCAAYLHDGRALVEEALAAGVAVLAVYEATPAQFAADDCAPVRGAKALGLEIVVDPERRLFRLFRTRSSLRAVFRVATLRARFAALRAGFGLGRLTGRLGQRPAHFLIDEQGVIAHAFEGQSIADHIDPEIVRKFLAPTTVGDRHAG